MGNKKKKSNELLGQVTTAKWSVSLPRQNTRDFIWKKLTPFVIYLLAVFGCANATLEIMKPKINLNAFLGCIFVFCLLWLLLCRKWKSRIRGRLLLWGSMGGLAVYCWQNWERLLVGGKVLGNIILSKSNSIYKLNLALFVIEKPDPDAAFLYLTLIFFLVTGLLGYCTLYRFSVIRLAILEILFLSFGLWMGKVPEHFTFFLMMAAIYGGAAFSYGKNLPNGRIQMRAVTLTLLLFLVVMAASRWMIGPALEPKLHALYETVADAEKKFENWIWQDKFEKLEFMNGTDSQRFTDGALGNDAPANGNEKVLEITLTRQPQKTLYLRGYVGTIYNGKRWSAPSEKDFYEEAATWCDGDFEPGIRAQNLYAENLEESLKNRGFTKNSPCKFSISYKNTHKDYAYLPYEAYFSEKLDANGEAWVEREKRKKLNASGTLFSDVPYAPDEPSEEEEDFRNGYTQYVYEHYTSFPRQNTKRLQSYVSGLKKQSISQTALIHDIRDAVRSHCSYSTDLDPLPPDADFAEHFFFESRRGFCTHFATTAVLMYRMAGIPARYRTGYVVSVEDFSRQKNGTWKASVTSGSAHAWPEVYHPDWGWIPVEATAGYGTGSSDSGQEPTTTPDAAPTEELPSETPSPEATPTKAPSAKPTVTATPETPRPSVSPEGGAPGGPGADGTADENTGSGIFFSLLLGLIKILLAVGVVLIAVLLRRELLVLGRLARMKQRNPSKAVIQISYALQEILAAGGYTAAADLYDAAYAKVMAKRFPTLPQEAFPYFIKLVQQARFSEDGCTVENAVWCYRFYKQLHKLLWAELTPARKIWWRFIKCF